MGNSTTFETNKKELVKQFESLIAKYSKFTNQVSPKNWRTTGHHITSLKEFKDSLNELEEISSEELKIDWVKKQVDSNT